MELKALAKGLGYEVKYLFEEKHSAVLKMDTRDELTNMRKLTKEDVERIFIGDITRLSRRAIDFISLINEFTEKGICLHFKDRNIVTLDENGKQDMFTSMYLYILGLFAQMDAENLKAKMRSGRERGLAIGHTYTGSAPYGYKVTNKHLYINENEIDTINLIYNQYIEGKTLQEISDILNAKKTPTRTGILWSRSSIYQIITNPVYKGKPQITTVTKTDQNKKPIETITRTFDAPIIIDPTIWDLAQKQREKNKTFTDKTKERQVLLRGILQCGACGKAYNTALNGAKLVTYICSDNRANINNKVGCKNSGVNSSFLDTLCWQTIKGIYEYKNFQETFAKEKIKNQKQSEENLKQIEYLLDKQNELDKESARVNKGYRIGIYSDAEAIAAKRDITMNKDRYSKLIAELEAKNLILKSKIEQDFSHYQIPSVDLSYAEKKEVCKELLETAKIYSYSIYDKVVQLELKMGLVFNLVFNSRSRSYYIVDNTTVTFNSPQSAPEVVKMLVKDFSVTSNNNDLFNEDVFGEYDFKEMWNIMNNYGFVKKLPKQ